MKSYQDKKEKAEGRKQGKIGRESPLPPILSKRYHNHGDRDANPEKTILDTQEKNRKNSESLGVRKIKLLLKIRRILLPCSLVFFAFFLLFWTQSISKPNRFTDDECLTCHEKPEISQITTTGKVRSVYVNPEEWSQDIHHKSKIACVDCHTNANPYVHFREGFIDVDCARCHPEEEEEYQKNIHLTFSSPRTPGKELPLCFHCHTKHFILRHDNPSASIHENNIGKTCGNCHQEVMVKAVLKGTSIGKISGHRKGDLSDKFDMEVCIKCHYEDSAHGSKRPYKDFCSRCHDVRSKGNAFMGPTHLKSKRWLYLNYTGEGLVLIFLLGACVIVGYMSRKGISKWIQLFMKRMKKDDTSTEKASEQESNNEG